MARLCDAPYLLHYGNHLFAYRGTKATKYIDQNGAGITTVTIHRPAVVSVPDNRQRAWKASSNACSVASSAVTPRNSASTCDREGLRSGKDEVRGCSNMLPGFADRVRHDRPTGPEGI
jgi:hypothetical protein